MGQAWLSLGANLNHPTKQLQEAVQRLRSDRRITVTATSTIIITPPWGHTDQPEFHNMAVAVETTLTPQQLLEACMEIEGQMGRKRSFRWGPRLIDIDIIAYDRLEMHSDHLTLPHEHAHERDFVLMPMREIAPEVADWLVARQEA